MTELEFLRFNPQINRREVAKKLGVHNSLISLWVGGKQRIPEERRINLRYILTKYGYK